MSTATLDPKPAAGLYAGPLPAKSKWLRANAPAGDIGVDKENRCIRGGVVAQFGDFKTPGRGSFNEDSLRLICRLAKTEPMGLKCRLAHANASDDGISRFLGRWSNLRMDTATVRRDGETMEIPAVRGDLQLSETAFEGNPNGNLGQYVLDLATEDPDALSSSLVLQVEEKMRMDNRGHPLKDDDGNPLPPIWMPTSLHGADIVAIGDAVDSLLSAGIDVDALPDAVLRQGAELLDRQFAGATRDVVEARLTAFAQRYLDHRFGEKLSPADKKLSPADNSEAKPEVCCCEWPTVRYRNGSGHHGDCPVHQEWLERGGSHPVPVGSKRPAEKTPDDVAKVDVKSCQRCGSDHPKLAFRKLANPANEWTHWALCPASQQPVLLQFTDDAEVVTVVTVPTATLDTGRPPPNSGAPIAGADLPVMPTPGTDDVGIRIGDMVCFYLVDDDDENALCVCKERGVVRSMIMNGTLSFPSTDAELEGKKDDAACLVQCVDDDDEDDDLDDQDCWYLIYQSRLTKVPYQDHNYNYQSATPDAEPLGPDPEQEQLALEIDLMAMELGLEVQALGANLSHDSKTQDNEPAWGQVDKTKLPRVAFADKGEADKKSTWSFPHHHVTGGKVDPDTGVYASGTLWLNQGGLNAAWSAAQGGRSGKKASPEVISHLQAHRKALGLDKD